MNRTSKARLAVLTASTSSARRELLSTIAMIVLAVAAASASSWLWLSYWLGSGTY